MLHYTPFTPPPEWLELDRLFREKLDIPADNHRTNVCIEEEWGEEDEFITIALVFGGNGNGEMERYAFTAPTYAAALDMTLSWLKFEGPRNG
jgi:hypothetical protein